MDILTNSEIQNSSLRVNISGYHLQFDAADKYVVPYSIKDCRTWGSSISAIRLCLAHVQATSDNDVHHRLVASIIPCPSDIALHNSCLNTSSWTVQSHSTVMSTWRRRALMTFDLANGRPLSAEYLTSPVPTSINVTTLLTSFDRLFDSTYKGLCTKTPQSVLVSTIWSYFIMLGSDPLSKAAAEISLRNILSIPLYYFKRNLITSDRSPIGTGPFSGLPPELYSTGSIASPRYRVNVARGSLIAYTCMGCTLLALAFGVLVIGSCLSIADRVPETSVFGVLDFVMRCEDLRYIANATAGTASAGAGSGGSGNVPLRESLWRTKGESEKEQLNGVAQMKFVAGSAP
ncbi:MAG: hypothetical protein M1814_006327 [Vezdaea aestivalis]|nr:MAG: hypothetical protein M1814_006327 [Vezdaea aestivalis]